MSEFRVVDTSNIEAVKCITIASESCKTGWGAGEKEFLNTLINYLNDPENPEVCLRTEHNYGDKIYKRGVLYLEEDEFFQSNPPPLGILMSDNYLEIYTDLSDKSDSLVGVGCSPTIKLIGDVQRLIGTYGLADHYLSEGKKGENIHSIFKGEKAPWSMVAGSRHVDFLINEVLKRDTILEEFGVTDPSWKVSGEPLLNSYGIYHQLHESGKHPFKILYIKVHKLRGLAKDPGFLSKLGVLSWNESSWYRRPFLGDCIDGLDNHSKTALVNRGTEHFVRLLGDFLNGEYPAPSFISLNKNVEGDKKKKRLTELRKHVPEPIEITHIVPRRYNHEDNNDHMEDGYIVWIYPLRLSCFENNVPQKADRHNMEQYRISIKTVLRKMQLNGSRSLLYAVFSESEINNRKGNATDAEAVAKTEKIIKQIVGENLQLVRNKQKVKFKLKSLQKDKPTSDEIVRVAKKYNDNILQNFVLIMIKP